MTKDEMIRCAYKGMYWGLYSEGENSIVTDFATWAVNALITAGELHPEPTHIDGIDAGNGA